MSAATPTEVVTAYFAGVRAGNADSVSALFAQDAVLLNAAGVLSGAAAISRMYESGLKAGAMAPSPKPFIVDGDSVAVEIELDADGAKVVLGDFFTVREGKITRLAIYSLTPDGGRLLSKVGIDPTSSDSPSGELTEEVQ